MLTFLVAYCGVVTSFIGPSAQGFVSEGAVVVIMNGDLVKKRATRIVGIARRKDNRRPAISERKKKE